MLAKWSSFFEAGVFEKVIVNSCKTRSSLQTSQTGRGNKAVGFNPRTQVIKSAPVLKGRRKMGSTLTNLIAHIVFSTKDRFPVISESIQDRICEYTGGIIRGEGGVLLAIGGAPDHVHMLAKIKTDRSMAEMVKRIKGNSSRWINNSRLVAGHFNWQDGYGAFSVSQSQCELVKQYILGQKEHHRIKTFQEEFVEFLTKQGLEYDEKYLWS